MIRFCLVTLSSPWSFHTRQLLAVIVVGAVVAAVFLSFFQRARETGGARQSKHNLKIIGLAVYNYEIAYRSLPPGMTRADDDTPLHSWQTLLLPFVGQEFVYRNVRLDVPWDASVNREACSTRIIEYFHPAEEPAAVGGYPVTHYAGNSQVLRPNRAMRIEEIRDGTSNVIFSGEVETGPKLWAQPGNVRDPADGLGLRSDQFGRRQSSKRISAYFLMLDGVVRYFDDRTDPSVMKGLASPGGGEPETLWP